MNITTILWPAHLVTGLWGEQEAERYLKKKGYRILSRRFRVTARDELDLVARQGEILIFVEVKTRKSESFGRPLASVDKRKRHVLCRAAVRYLQKLKHPLTFRFDVIEVIGEEGQGNPLIRHIENAFTLDTCYILPW
jgi:putative endonuclease